MPQVVNPQDDSAHADQSSDEPPSSPDRSHQTYDRPRTTRGPPYRRVLVLAETGAFAELLIDFEEDGSLRRCWSECCGTWSGGRSHSLEPS